MERGRTNSTRTSGLRFDCAYLKSPSGVLKIIQVVSSLISFICTETFYASQNPVITLGWLRTATVTGFIVSLVFLILYLIHFLEKFDRLPCLLVDMFICVLWAMFNLSVFWVTTASDKGPAVNAILVFSFVSVVAYACDALLKLIRIIRKQPVQD